MNFRVTIGKTDANRTGVVGSGKLRKLAGASGVTGVGIENLIVNAIGMFIQKNPALGRTGVV